MLAAATFFEGYDTFVLALALPLIRKDFGLTLGQSGLVASIVFVGSIGVFALLTLATGWEAVRSGRGPVALPGLPEAAPAGAAGRSGPVRSRHRGLAGERGGRAHAGRPPGPAHADRPPLRRGRVADHSDFPAEPFQRLWRTMDAMLRVSFGDADQSREAAEQITEVHRRVASRRRDGVGYRAMDPDLLLWVHATVVDSALVVHRCFFRALTPDQEARYYHEMKRLATAMHVPSGILPSGLEEFRTYMAGVVERVEVSEDARRLAPSILRPPLLPRWGRCRSW